MDIHGRIEAHNGLSLSTLNENVCQYGSMQHVSPLLFLVGE